jgi:glycosyltransferase involved in cell wall biosynthesis
MFRSLSIVLPAYNEQDNVTAAVGTSARAAAAVVPDYEVLVVDDGSRDATAERLAALVPAMEGRLRVLRHPVNRGYGAALRAGFQAARGELVFYTDSDNQFDLAELGTAISLMERHDAVLGYRVRRQDPFARLCSSAVFNRLTCLALGLRVRDLNCSFKLFRGDVLRALPLRSEDFFIDAELVACLDRAGARWAQVPVRHLPRRAGRSTVRVSDVPRTLRSLVRMRARLRAHPAAAAAGDARS